MSHEPIPIGVNRLVAQYKTVARRGRYIAGEADELAKLCDNLLSRLPPHRRIVAFTLMSLFASISERFDEIVPNDAVGWATLNTAVFAAVTYVAKGDAAPLDAIGIVDKLQSVARSWLAG
jgi:hypothetical protein